MDGLYIASPDTFHVSGRNFCHIMSVFLRRLGFFRLQSRAFTDLACDNDTLSVTWSTGIMFDATVTSVPGKLAKRLTDRIVEGSKYPILGLVIISRQPP